MSSWIAAATVVRQPRRADDPVLHLLLDVRLPARRRPRLGGRRHRARAASCSAAPPGARRSTARACSTRTATATCWRRLIPNCVAYDPTYAYELAVIVQDGLRRMFAEQEDVFYYLTVMNENYAQPAMPEGARGGDPARDVPAARGAEGDAAARAAARLGTILREVLGGGRAAARGLRRRAPTSGASRQLHRAAPRRASRPSAGTACTRREEPRDAVRRRSALGGRAGPVVAATDYMRALRRPDPRRGCRRRYARARHRRLRPQRLPRARCAASSRSTATTSRVAALHALGRRRVTPASRGDRAVRIDPEAEAPMAEVTRGRRSPTSATSPTSR